MAEFAAYQRAARRSPGTIRLYHYRLLMLAETVGKPCAVTERMLLSILGREGWKPETVRSVRTSFRSFYSWARRTGRLPHDPTEHLPPVKTHEPPPKPAPERVVRRSLLEATPRERFMMLLGAYAGLRASEISRVHGDHWDGTFLTVLGKGGKTRKVAVVQPELVLLLDVLDGYAFPNRWTGEPITPGHVTKLLSAALSDVWTSHTLRHRYGTVTLEETKDLLAVAEQLGHSSTNTTRRYCKVSRDRLLAVAKAAAA